LASKNFSRSASPSLLVSGYEFRAVTPSPCYFLLWTNPYLASSPLLDCSGLPCVDVTAGGNTHFKMLVDTGNELSMEDKAKAEALGLELKSLREDYPFQLESRRVTLVQISFRGAAVLPLSATKLHENANLRFVIPSEAEGSAVRLSPKQRPLQVSSQLFGAVVSFLLELSRHAVAN
jgi:hypothetical protein